MASTSEIEDKATRKAYRALIENETKEVVVEQQDFPDDPFNFQSEIEDQATRKAYRALLQKEAKEVVLEQCKKFSDGPFHLLTIHKDTVLQVATSCKRADLVHELLKMVPDDQRHKLTHKNQVGNTILHEASTSNKLVPAAEEMLNKAPDLLNMRNNFGETPLYRSVVFGKMEMFEFLDQQIRKGKPIIDQRELERFHFYNKSKTNILHAAVTNRTFGFDLALLIAKKYKYLVGEENNHGMTALQLLACNPWAFRFHLSSDESTEDATQKEAGHWRVPYWEKVQKEKRRHESALKLAKFLIKEDTSWKETGAMEETNAPKYHPSSQPSATPSEKEENKTETGQPSEMKENKIPEKPLILATRYGYVEMVKEIFEVYPWAVEYIDRKGRTILHVAIKYRQMEVLDLVEKMGVLGRLRGKVDNNLNTILHMVGEETTDRIVPKLQGPAFELQENLLLFERVREICPRSLENTLNTQHKTAQQLFEEMNKPLREEATEWIKRTAENCSIVAVLIATVAFASAYTIPGGSDQSTGFPILLNRPFFVVFTTADVLSITLALTAVIIFLRILTFTFRLEEMLMLGVTLLIVSVTMMMIAFAATVILMTHNRGNWTKVALFTASFVPVSIFAVSYLPLYLSLMKTHSYSLKKKVALIFPRFNKSKPKQIGTSNSTSRPKLRASSNNPV
ncbi:hypothetical protein Vadar_024255 [Vaccinium darrowii]|uniref:Uncharacterized protein n=1 Tax=Vaccinium darrowii TaxID=229202 RepID=A0ACB7Z6W4_9ERIC|nr:hypothetical protein Vadar_024255 [Vaccinium darrowii]